MRGLLLGASSLAGRLRSSCSGTGRFVVSDREGLSAHQCDCRCSPTVDSNEELSNQIGQPERARLVMRCQEGVLAFWSAWPQVLSHDGESILLSMPETMVAYKTDDNRIRNDFWVISDDGTAAGSFDNVGAPKLINKLAGASQFVIGIRKTVAQDASFDINPALTT